MMRQKCFTLGIVTFIVAFQQMFAAYQRPFRNEGTALHKVVDTCGALAVRELSQDKQLLDQLNGFGKTALYRAVELFQKNQNNKSERASYLEIIEILLQNGADIKILPSHAKQTYLAFAAGYGYCDLLMVFLEHGNYNEHDIENALRAALHYYRDAAVQMLYEHRSQNSIPEAGSSQPLVRDNEARMRHQESALSQGNLPSGTSDDGGATVVSVLGTLDL